MSKLLLFQSIKVPENYSVKFFNRVLKTYNISRSEALKLARGDLICLPSGECIDPGDAGNVCCT